MGVFKVPDGVTDERRCSTEEMTAEDMEDGDSNDDVMFTPNAVHLTGVRSCSG